MPWGSLVTGQEHRSHNATGVVSLQDRSTDTQCHGGSPVTGQEHMSNAMGVVSGAQTHNAMGVVSLQDRSTDARCHGGSLVTGQEHRRTMPWG